MDLWFYGSIDDLLSDEESLDAVAMSLFNALGHTCASTALLSDNDPMHFVYGALATKTVLSPSDRAVLLQAKELALLFKLDGTVFDKTIGKEIYYFSIELSVSAGERSSVASALQIVISHIVSANTVILFRNESKYMISFSASSSEGKESVVLSDWFFAGSHCDSFFESLAVFNFSFASSSAFYADFRHAAARQYYTYPCSREYVRYAVLSSILPAGEEQDFLTRDDISEMVRSILLEPILAYGDDYVDDAYLADYSTDELEDTDFDLLEYELEQLGAFDDDFQEPPFEDEVELALQPSDSPNLQIDSTSIPADVMRDPVKLLTWLEHHENEKNRDAELRPQVRDIVRSEDVLIEALELEDLDYIDNRSKGGVLWIIGGPEIASFIDGLSEKLGYRFTFKAGGGRATTGEDAWWMK